MRKIRKIAIMMRKIKFYLKKSRKYLPNSLKYLKSILIFVFILWDEIFEGSMSSNNYLKYLRLRLDVALTQRGTYCLTTPNTTDPVS